MQCHSKVWLSIFQVNREDDTVRPSFQDYAEDLKVSIDFFCLEDSGTCIMILTVISITQLLTIWQLHNLIG